MKTKPIVFRALFIIVALITITLTGCGKTDPAIQAVKNSITNTSASGQNYQTGPLEGGTAVLVDDMAAYWVSGGIVFAANGLAKTWSPTTSYASSGNVTYDSVKASVQ